MHGEVHVVQAAQAMQQYAGWEPKEFSEQAQPQESAWQPQEFQEPQAAQPSEPALAAASQTATGQQAMDAAAQWQSQQQQQHAFGQEQQAGQQQLELGQAPGQWQQDASGAWTQQPHAGSEAQQGGAGAQYQDWQSAQQQGEQQQQQQQQHNQQAAWSGAPGQPNVSQQWQQQQQHQHQQQTGLQQAGSNAEAAHLPSEQNLPASTSAGTGAGPPQQLSQGQSNPQSGFVYDSASGYWHDAASGYYYDANTGLYCHPQTQQWYSQDPATGEFRPYAAAEGISTAGANALGESSSPLGSAECVQRSPRNHLLDHNWQVASAPHVSGPSIPDI